MIYSSKALSYFIIFLLNFFTGIEYAVILPTALQFLKRYNGDQIDLGFCLSAYSFSSLFSSPIMGRWSDKTKNTKLIMIIANFFQIAGSLMYFMGISKYFIIAGRLVAGIGLGAVSSTFSDVIKNTSVEERSPILSRIMIGRQIGMIIGPAFNFIFLHINYKIGPFVLDKLSAPGLFMVLAWSLLQIIIIFFYKNLYQFKATDSVEPSETSRLIVNTDETSYNSVKNENEKYDSIMVVDNSETGPLILRLYNEYIRHEVVAVYASTFTVFLMQTSLETMLTPFTKDYFNWTDIENSVLFAVAGLEIMVVFLLLSFLSKKFKDRTLLLIGLIGNLSTLIFLIVYLPMAKPGQNDIKSYALFMIPVLGNVFSLPFIVLASISLLSKITSLNSQGLTQGIRRTVVGIACILGPNWAGSFYNQWYILIGSLIFLILISLTMSLLSYKNLNTKTNNIINNQSNSNQE